MSSTPVFVRQESNDVLPPPVSDTGVLGWVRANLFNGVFNTILTLAGAYLIWITVSNLFMWGIWNATFEGETREACTTGGACWPFVAARWEQFLFGFYPAEERWRVILAFAVIVFGFLPLFIQRFEFKTSYMVGLVVFYPLVAYWLFTGGSVGLPMPADSGLYATIAWAALVFFGFIYFIGPVFGSGPKGSGDYLLFVIFTIIPAGFVYLALCSMVVSGWQAFYHSLMGNGGSQILSFVLLGLLAIYIILSKAFANIKKLATILVVFALVAMFCQALWNLGTLIAIGDEEAAPVVLEQPAEGDIAAEVQTAFGGTVYGDDSLRYAGPTIDLVPVETSKWGGLFLTLVLAGVAITSSLPLGILLALGRRSDMPIVSTLCTIFIEFVRGVPLITVLFMASVMLPLFLPEGVNFDKLLRALVGLSLFAAAYMAEIIRGGLQAIPKGQYEAADALGLSYWKKMGLIVLPQALKISIPNIVSLFIGLFKDTTLVLIIGLFDFLNTIQTGLSDANWIGLSKEGYIFAAIVYFIFCFSMSRYSAHLERKLDTGHKR